MSSSPFFSIVMPCYQQAAFLEEAVRSVLDQKGVDVELLVMDPGSTDGSRELLTSLKETYGKRLVLHFEPDQGQSDAVNRGMALTRGRILGWLNSDDRLRPDALAQVGNFFKGEGPRWLYGKAGMIDEQGRFHSSLIFRYKNWRGRRFSLFKLLTENFIPQMAVFWNRTMWDRAGGLNPDLDLDMDYDLWLRFARVAAPIVLPVELADFRVHSAAKGSLQPAEQLDAAIATAQRHAVGLGLKGRAALLVHRLFSWRTKVFYLWLNYKEKR